MPPVLRSAASTATAKPPWAPLLPGASTAMRFDTTTRRCAGPGATAMRVPALRDGRTTVSIEAGGEERGIWGDGSAERAEKTASYSTPTEERRSALSAL